ncbi:DedA family protein [Streptomyces cacaoi]|uniref:DedA family protein n=1 Tax=Streptomyces cacaoi TaxID=1898 RepID=UPI002621CBD2|nr:VTT domain-containing protein [Streptomyces cacaoi]
MTQLALGPSWLDPDFLIQTFGPIGILAIVFAESGLLIGFFLPGDSLLFTAGLLVVTNQLHLPLWLMCVLIVLAAVLGDQAGYWFGKKVGPTLFRRPDSRLFKQENVEKAHEFFEKHGPKSLVLARFVPVVRTFTPIIAGVSGMRYRSFIAFNVLGGTLWGAGVTLLGAALGQVEFVHKNIEAILVGIVLLSVVPIAIEYLRNRRKTKKAEAEAAARGEAVAGAVPGAAAGAAPGTAAGAAPGAPVPPGPPPAPGAHGMPGAPGAHAGPAGPGAPQYPEGGPQQQAPQGRPGAQQHPGQPYGAQQHPGQQQGQPYGGRQHPGQQGQGQPYGQQPGQQYPQYGGQQYGGQQYGGPLPPEGDGPAPGGRGGRGRHARR